MSGKEKPEENAACSFCGKLTKDVEIMFSGGEHLAICNECVTRCMAVMDDRKSDGIPTPRFLGQKYRETNRQLRPLTKLPAGWKIKDTELYATEPYVTGCSPDGKRYADFAIPKQLAWWIISNDKALDVDELRAEITKHLTYVVWQTLLKY